MGGAPSHSAPRADMTERTGRRAAARPDLAAPALRLPDPQAPLRPLHAGGRLRRCAAARRRSSCGWRSCSVHNSGRERTSAIVYAVGWTQHTTGVQMIRTAGILQLLLGNIGRPGGGIMAMRGHSTIQGSTDIATLYDLLPGYLPQPAADEEHETLDSYVEHEGLPTGYWANFRKFIVSLLKAWYGDAATPDNDFGFSWLPRVDGDYSQLPYFDRMAQGRDQGLLPVRPEPRRRRPQRRPAPGRPAQPRLAGGRSTGSRPRAPSSGRATRTAPPPAEIKTEVFFIPAAAVAGEGGHASPTRSGCSSGTTRPSTRPATAAPTPGSSTTSASASSSSTPARPTRKDQPLLNLTWDYDFDEQPRLPDGTLSRIEGEPDLEKVLQEINGYQLNEIDPRTGRPRLVERLLRAEGRRLDGVRLLDLQRRLPRAGPQPGARAQAHRQPAPARMGLRLAAQPPHPVQPRLGRPRGPAVVGAQEARLVGRGEAPLGRASTSRTSSRTSRPTTGRRPARRAWPPSPATSRSS